MAAPIPGQSAAPVPRPWVKEALMKAGALTLLMVFFALVHGWAEPRFYGPERVAGFGVGMMHGALMPMALPNLLMGKDVPIFAEHHEGRIYKLGYITGINLCGMLFFGFAFWRPRSP
ncbi:MAG: hypothetical protein WCT12_06890 [Verrucomicrobiota bacterium]